MPSPDPMKFKDLAPAHIRTRGRFLVVSGNGISFGNSAYVEMGSPQTVYVQVSEDGTALKVGPGGPFGVVTTTNGRARANGRIIAANAQPGRFFHYQDDLYILQ